MDEVSDKFKPVGLVLAAAIAGVVSAFLGCAAFVSGLALPALGTVGFLVEADGALGWATGADFELMAAAVDDASNAGLLRRRSARNRTGHDHRAAFDRYSAA